MCPIDMLFTLASGTLTFCTDGSLHEVLLWSGRIRNRCVEALALKPVKRQDDLLCAEIGNNFLVVTGIWEPLLLICSFIDGESTRD